MTRRRIDLGRTGEDLAAERLERDGATVIARNVRIREGEIDLIVAEGPAVAFVEVKTLGSHASTGPERPALAVGPHKQRRIRRLAAAWLATRPALPPHSDLRFDVVGIRLGPTGRVVEYEHLRGAF